MKASDVDKEEMDLDASSPPSSAGWLRIVGAAVAIVLICAIWTFWN
jgi:hypothetical protein